MKKLLNKFKGTKLNIGVLLIGLGLLGLGFGLENHGIKIFGFAIVFLAIMLGDILAENNDIDADDKPEDELTPEEMKELVEKSERPADDEGLTADEFKELLTKSGEDEEE